MTSLSLSIYFALAFLGLHPRHMEVPRPGGQSELPLLVYTMATATWDLSCVCDLHPSSRQRRILNLRSKARNRTLFLMDPSWICYP